jgi:general secretion pathway protein H
LVRQLLTAFKKKLQTSNLEPRTLKDRAKFGVRSSTLVRQLLTAFKKKLRTSNLEPRTSFQKGFTLMELMVVIAILSIAAAIVVPRLPSTESARLRDSARSLASAIRFIGDRAATTKAVYRMHFNISDNIISIRRITSGGEETTADDSYLNRPVLAEGIMIEDVLIPQTGRVGEGEVIVGFGPAGLQDFLIVHLKDSGSRHFTVTSFPGSGKVKVEEGYQEAAP